MSNRVCCARKYAKENGYTDVDIRKGDIEKKTYLLCLLVPALFSGVISNLWLYWPAIFVGTSIVALILRKKFVGR